MKKTPLQIACLLACLALLLSACGAVSVKSEVELTAEFETAVAVAAEALITPDTPTPVATQTYIPSETPSPTITLTPTPITPTATSIADTYCDNSAFVADVTIPDETLLAPGTVFEKTWSLQNTGQCTWKPGYTIVFLDGHAMQGTTRAVNQTVAPGETVEVTVRLTAPNTPGRYTGAWRLANGKSEPFGDFVGVVINVAGPGTTVPGPEAPALTVTPTP